jgi:hypothetical protein
MTFLAVYFFTPAFSWASRESSELKSLIACHEALMDKSDGRSAKLVYDGPTPFVIPKGKHLFFVTNDSIDIIENNFAKKSIVFKLREAEVSLYRKVNFQADGSLGTISFEKPGDEELKSAIRPMSKLDNDTLNVVKKELLRRMNSVTGEYQNKYNPQATIASLEECRKVKSDELQASIQKQIAFYQKLSPKKYGPKQESSPKKTSAQ